MGGRTVFQPNKIIPIVILAVLVIGSFVAYLQLDFPIWIVPIVLVVGGFVVFSMSKTKIIIEDGFLRYETLGGGEEVDLNKVSQIIIREVETIVNKDAHHDRVEPQEDVKLGTIRIGGQDQPVNQERQVERIMYFLDADGRTIFSMSANALRFSERRRFAEAVNAVNPDIQVF